MTAPKPSSAAPFSALLYIIDASISFPAFSVHHHLGFALCAAARCLCGWSIRSQRGAMTRSLISLPVRFQTPVCLPPAILTSADGQSISIGSTVAKCGIAAFLVFRDASLNLYLKSRWSEIDPRLPRTLVCTIIPVISLMLCHHLRYTSVTLPLHLCGLGSEVLWLCSVINRMPIILPVLCCSCLHARGRKSISRLILFQKGNQLFGQVPIRSIFSLGFSVTVSGSEGASRR